tara:strand:- start:3414 stop:4271 length:858 start_codon:yes stop_codon:yes gene_type:complete
MLLMLSSIAGCSNTPASVSDRSQPPDIRIKNHRVEVGETLYSIAWRYDLSIYDLARANSLVTPYTINPGQKLSLVVTKIQHAVTAGDTLFSIASKYDLAVEGLAAQNSLSPPYLITPGQILSLDLRSTLPSKSQVIRTADVATSEPINRTSPRLRPQAKLISKPLVYSSNWEWKWPVDGQVVETFNPSKLQKGIKLKASNGSQVRAAAPGNVVYAGSGLRGYGRLIIIKHSDILLSAYANNDKLLVSVGQSVTQADVISSLGVDGTMYFEIRKDGDPVYPISYLK